jgi:Rad3-related DNA helicase
MRDIINILDEYLKGDAQKRLNLFLSYRSLRRQFYKIEQNEIKNIEGKSFNNADEVIIKKRRRSRIIPLRLPGISCLKPKSG